MKTKGLLYVLLLASFAAQAGIDPPIFTDGFESRCGLVTYQEDFAVGDGDPWPPPWVWS